MQQDEIGTPPGDVSPDSEDRIKDFLARHGGPESGAARREQVDPAGLKGWYEVYAADGYRLRCEWSRMGSREELQFREIRPHTNGASNNRA